MKVIGVILAIIILPYGMGTFLEIIDKLMGTFKEYNGELNLFVARYVVGFGGIIVMSIVLFILFLIFDQLIKPIIRYIKTGDFSKNN